ncbi:MAG TPA: hypothetical protein VN905_11835 [Candidatus Binatia bacterium]|nr:hypothetical protein [Candidatus Binatia bacterium]
MSAYGNAAGSTRAPLDMAIQNATLSANGANTLSMTLLPAAYGAQIMVTGGGGMISASQWSPFENFPSSQTATLQVTPFDAFGNTISGSTGNAVVINGPAGSSFPNVSAAGSATATYAAGSNSIGTVTTTGTFLPSGVSVVSPPPNTTIALQPDYYIFATSGSSVAVFDALRGSQVGSTQSLATARQVQTAPKRVRPAAGSRRSTSATRRTQTLSGNVYAMAATGASTCPGANFAAAGVFVGYLGGYSNGAVEIVTVSQSGAVSAPAVLQWQPSGTSPSAVAIDANCTAYVGDSLGYLGVVQNVGSGSPSLTMNPNYDTFVGGHSFDTFLVANNTLYIAGNFGSYFVGTYPLGSTTATISGNVFASAGSVSGWMDNASLALAGGNVYAGYSMGGNCLFTALNGTGTISSFGTSGNLMQVSGSPNGLYAVDYYNNTLNFANPLSVSSAQALSAPSGANCFYGVALSKDATNSTLWTTGWSNNVCYAYSLPIPNASAAPVASFHPTTISASNLAIAP